MSDGSSSLFFPPPESDARVGSRRKGGLLEQRPDSRVNFEVSVQLTFTTCHVDCVPRNHVVHLSHSGLSRDVHSLIRAEFGTSSGFKSVSNSHVAA